MHKVHDHVVGLAVDLLYARLVEVELDKLVALSIDDNAACARRIDLDAVAVIDDL